MKQVNAAPASDSVTGAATGSATMPGVDATPEELDRLNAALRDDRR